VSAGIGKVQPFAPGSDVLGIGVTTTVTGVPMDIKEFDGYQ